MARPRRGSRAGLLLVVAVALAAAYAAGQLSPVSSTARKVRVTVPTGASAAKVAGALKAKGLIRSAAMFRLMARVHGGWDVKAGAYRLSPSMSAGRILDVLNSGDVEPSVRVTFPEGFTLRQTAERAARIPGVSAAAFEDLAAREGRSFHAPMALPANLEGYLFPDTYDFAPDATPRQVIQTMVDTFDEKVRTPLAPQFAAAGKRGFDLSRIVILASLIEREAKVKKDQPLIAAVLYNRLRIGMPLQVDATIQYVIGHKDRVLYKDLDVDSPYNTYKVTGLPPGPICSPGVDAIRAALNPAKAPYLFYTANADGSHTFTTTLEKHVEATAQARAAMRKKDGAGG
jgi:UPF0755 protein